MRLVRKIEPSHQCGWSLVEYLCYLILIAVLVGVSVSSYHSSLTDTRVRVLQRSLQSSLHEAMTLARHDHLAVGLCGSTDGKHCVNNWAHGWIIYGVVSGQPLAFYPGPGIGVLTWMGALHKGVIMSATGRPDGVEGSWHWRMADREVLKLTLLRTGRLAAA